MFINFYLESVTGEFFGTKVTACSSLSASILEMILHENPRNHSTALVTAGHRVVFACVQVSLEVQTDYSLNHITT